MRPEAGKYVRDIAESLELRAVFTSGKSLSDYSADRLLQSAVERQFEIIGEALSKLVKVDLATAEQVTEYRRIIAFRNILIHGYAEIDDRLVWDIVETKLPDLRRDLARLEND